MKRKICILITTTLLSMWVFAGCKATPSTVPDDVDSVEVSVTPEDATGAPTETPSDPEKPVEDPVDIGELAEPTTAPEEAAGAGEGTNEIAPGSTAVADDNAITLTLDQSIEITRESGDYELTIDKIESTDARNEHASEAAQVISVTFTYQNKSMDEPLLIDDLGFHMTDKDNIVCTPYYLDNTDNQSLPAEKGDSCTAVISFAPASPTDSVTLFYSDTVTENAAQYVLTTTVS